MTLNDPGKLIVILVALIGGLLLAITGVVVEDAAALTAGTGLAGIAVGYVTGNGRLATRTEAPSTMLAPTLPTDQYVHVDDVEALNELAAARTRTRAKVARAVAKDAKALAQGEHKAGAR